MNAFYRLVRVPFADLMNNLNDLKHDCYAHSDSLLTVSSIFLLQVSRHIINLVSVRSNFAIIE